MYIYIYIHIYIHIRYRFKIIKLWWYLPPENHQIPNVHNICKRQMWPHMWPSGFW